MLVLKAAMMAMGLLGMAVALPIMGRAGSSPAKNKTIGIGLRSRWTKASPEAWVAGHAAAYPVMMAAGVTAGILGVFTLLLALLLGGSWGYGPALLTGTMGYLATMVLTGTGIWRSIVAARAVL